MGIFNKLFGTSIGSITKKEKKVLPWIALNSTEQLNTIVEASHVKPQLIFKYSTRCGISRMVLNQFVDGYNLSEADLDLYFLDLISCIDVSDEVGYKFQVMHESPQLLVIKNGVVVVHGSHGAVNSIELEQYI